MPLSDGGVIVRLPTVEDIPLLTQYGNDDKLLQDQWVGTPSLGVDTERWASRCVDEWRKGWTKQGSDLGPALIVDERQPFVGVIHCIAHATGTLELLYGVLPTARQRGIASRAVRLVSDWALATGFWCRIELRIGATHHISQRVAENAGFKFEEKFETFVTGTGQTYVDWLYLKTQA